MEHNFQMQLLFLMLVHGAAAWAQEVTTLTPTPFNASGGLSVDAEGNIFVANTGNQFHDGQGKEIYKVTPAGEVSLFADSLLMATGNTFGSQGNLYQASYDWHRVDKISPDGVVTTFAGANEGINNPAGLAFDSQGNLYVANCNIHTIRKITPGGISTEFVANNPQMNCPTGLAFDKQDNLYVTHYRESLIHKVRPAGTVSTFADTVEWTGPIGRNQHIIFAHERLYIAGYGSHRVFELSLTGELTVLAGSGERGRVDGPLLEASLQQPVGIGISPDGRLLYVNTGESDSSLTPNVVRVIELPGFNQEEFQINAGHSGAWFNPATSGQGQFIDVVPEDQFMFISWFTFTDAASDNSNEQQWYTAQGNYSGDTAVLDLFETLGGEFDLPQDVTTSQVGEVTLTFSDCDMGMMSYSFDAEELEGEFPLIRVIPDSDNVCEGISGNSAQAVDINAGMDGAWFDPATSGQGYFIDAHPDPEGGNFIFVSWFTYGNATASGQRWLTAQGGFEGSTAEIDVFETTGGSFDDPEPADTTKVGTMSLDFTDCSNAQLTYSLSADPAEGDIAITRVIPGSQALCEELAGED